MNNDNLYLVVSPTAPGLEEHSAGGQENPNPGIRLLTIAAGEQAKTRMKRLTPAL